MKPLYPLLFEPDLHSVVWGGTRLRPMKGLPADSMPVGESWEVCSLPGNESIISNGPLAGLSLNELSDEVGERLLGHAVVEQYGTRLPLLVKFIDAQSDLSIQVHPDDEMAMRLHGKRGKTEMWYIIDAEPGAAILAGFKERLTPEQYAASVANGTICRYLARHEVKAGDVFHLPAGRVHAICGGILLAEVQQSSDITYRIFDYNRPGIDGLPRELHTELAAEAINYEVLDDYRTHYLDKTDKAVPVIRSPHFNIRVLDINRSFHRNMLKYDSFVISICLRGRCAIVPRMTDAHHITSQVILNAGHSCLIPAALADYDIIPHSPDTHILETFIDNKNTGLAAIASRFFHLSNR